MVDAPASPWRVSEKVVVVDREFLTASMDTFASLVVEFS